MTKRVVAAMSSVLALALFGCGGSGTTGTTRSLGDVTGRPVAEACPITGADQCQVDADCPTGQACLCASLQYGNAVHVNACVPAGCHVDADCPGGQCTLVSTGCWSGGYQCTTPADECRVDTDCAPPDGGFPGRAGCRWAPEVGHLQCNTTESCPAG